MSSTEGRPLLYVLLRRVVNVGAFAIWIYCAVTFGFWGLVGGFFAAALFDTVVGSPITLIFADPNGAAYPMT